MGCGSLCSRPLRATSTCSRCGVDVTACHKMAQITSDCWLQACGRLAEVKYVEMMKS